MSLYGIVSELSTTDIRRKVSLIVSESMSLILDTSITDSIRKYQLIPDTFKLDTDIILIPGNCSITDTDTGISIRSIRYYDTVSVLCPSLPMSHSFA